MALTTLTLSTLKDFDYGKIQGQFDAEMAKVVADLRSRPTVTKARMVRLTVKLEPQHEPKTGDCETALIQFSVESKVPKADSLVYQAAVRENSTLVVNAASPGDVQQHTLDELKRPETDDNE